MFLYVEMWFRDKIVESFVLPTSILSRLMVVILECCQNPRAGVLHLFILEIQPVRERAGIYEIVALLCITYRFEWCWSS